MAQHIVEPGRTRLDVLNLSLVCFTEDGQPPLVLASGIDRLDPDVVVVAAAGNHGEFGPSNSPAWRKPAWPAALDDVVAVGAGTATGPARRSRRRTPPGSTCAQPAWTSSAATSTEKSTSICPRGPRGARGSRDGPTGDGSSFAAALVSGAIAAKTDPGRVPARQAWQNLLRTAEASDGGPPFLRLATL